MRAFDTVSMMLLAASAAFAEDPLVVLAADRTGHIRIFDATLAPMAAIGVHQLVESVSASPDGRRLYVAQPTPKRPGDCCSLYALDLETRTLCFVTAPALFGAPSPDGRFLFTQGAQGVDVFDAATLSRRQTMKAPGAYNLQPSPDGRWLLGITNSPKPSVDIFDMKARAMVRQVSIPAGPATGAWAGDRFYVFNYGGGGQPGTGSLWSVKPETGELGPAKPILLPDLHGACKEPVLLTLAGSPDRLFLAEAFGFKVDRRLACPDQERGGIYAIQPSTGRVGYIAPSVRVNRMVVTPDGHDLYVIHSSGPSPLSNVSLIHIDARMSRVVFNIPLETGEWNLSLAHIPPALIPRENARAITYCSR
jgi:DNA-binding beta-propeller fold protein YncE